MNYDQFGRAYTTETELCDLLYLNPGLDLSKFSVEDYVQYNTAVTATYSDLPLVQEYHPYPDDYDVDRFHQSQQSCWLMPEEYKKLDIAEHVLNLCSTQAELQRVGEELILFQERDLFDLLRYLKYFVDVMQKNSVLWGLGRGSSVASYVLYLLKVHRINSMYYDLDIREFLK
jgi:DNA polymerase III alpha subunit